MSTERQRKVHSDFGNSEVVNCMAILGQSLKRHMGGLAEIPVHWDFYFPGIYRQNLQKQLHCKLLEFRVINVLR